MLFNFKELAASSYEVGSVEGTIATQCPGPSVYPVFFNSAYNIGEGSVVESSCNLSMLKQQMQKLLE